MIRNAITVCLIWLAETSQTITKILLEAAKRRVRRDIFKSDGANKK